MNEFVKHIRNENGEPIATFVAKEKSNKVEVGFSIFNPKYNNDKIKKSKKFHFSNKNVALSIAKARASKYFDKDDLNKDTKSSAFKNLKARYDKQFSEFLVRCFNIKNFQNKKFPKWIFNNFSAVKDGHDKI